MIQSLPHNNCLSYFSVGIILTKFQGRTPSDDLTYKEVALYNTDKEKHNLR